VSFTRGFLPRPVLRVMHPMYNIPGSVKRLATPKPVSQIYYAVHPVGTLTTHLGRRIRRSLMKR